VKCVGWWVAASLATSLVACGSVPARQDAGGDDSPDGNQTSDGLAVSPIAYEFGPVALNALSRPVAFTFVNNGGSPATGCAVAAKGGTDPGEFSIVSDECGTTDLAPTASCKVTIVAKPTTAGAKAMTLSRTCAEGGSASTMTDGLAANRPVFIFVTSAKYNGNLGGLAGADTFCKNAGTSGQLTAGLNKTWKALLSMTTGGTTINAKDRFVWTGPLYNVTNNMVVQDPATWPLVATSSTADINKNQNGGPPGGSSVWSGSSIDGTAKPNLDCNGWTDESTSFDGWTGQTGDFPLSSRWFDSAAGSCGSQSFSLYCISQ
jgi:hypothetical protein